MSKFKHLFVYLFILFLLFVLFWSSYQFVEGQMDWIWFGNIWTASMGIGFFLYINLFEVPRTSRQAALPWLLLMIGTFIVLAEFYQRTAGVLAVGLNLAMIVGWYLYLHWSTQYSDRDTTVLRAGEPLPNLKLRGVDNSVVMSDSFQGQPTIYLFYKGNWSPFCMAQMKELAKKYHRIEAAGAQLVFISPQSSEKAERLANQLEIPATFLVDEGLEAANALRLYDFMGTQKGMKSFNLGLHHVLPTLVVTDSQGIIRYADLTDNYRIRPEPSEYLDLLEEIS